MQEKIEVLVIKVQHGTPIRKAAAEVFGNSSGYYRNATDQQKATVLRARRECEEASQMLPDTRLVPKRITMPASRRLKLQQVCDQKKQPVNTVVNKLLNCFIKNPKLFDQFGI